MAGHPFGLRAAVVNFNRVEAFMVHAQCKFGLCRVGSILMTRWFVNLRLRFRQGSVLLGFFIAQWDSPLRRGSISGCDIIRMRFMGL